MHASYFYMSYLCIYVSTCQHCFNTESIFKRSSHQFNLEKPHQHTHMCRGLKNPQILDRLLLLCPKMDSRNLFYPLQKKYSLHLLLLKKERDSFPTPSIHCNITWTNSQLSLHLLHTVYFSPFNYKLYSFIRFVC